MKPSNASIIGEAGALLRLAGPLMAAQIAQTSMGFVDTVMVGKVGPEDLAAVAMGTGLWHPLYLFVIGVLMAGTMMRHGPCGTVSLIVAPS